MSTVFVKNNPTTIGVTNFPLSQKVTIFDYNGNGIGSSSNAMNVNLVGGNVGISAQSAGLALDASIQTLISILQSPLPMAGGTLWNAASVIDGNASASINMTSKNIGINTIMGNTSASAKLALQYSPDNSNWFNTTTAIITTGDFTLDFQSSASYIRLFASSIATTSTISGYLNRA